MARTGRRSHTAASAKLVSNQQHSQRLITLGLYLWTRIRQCGIRHIFGVPGDFNLALLDYIDEVDDLDFTGSTNELNAAYSADGYARVKAGAGCLVTTHGVGELSAINGVAGSMAEHVKVIHVVGQTSRQQQSTHEMMHHNIGEFPDHQIFNRAGNAFRCAGTVLWSEKTAADEIDRVLRECFMEVGPVSIHIPMDMVTSLVPAGRLDVPLDLSFVSDAKAVRAAAAYIHRALSEANRPAIFVDHLVRQHDAIKELHSLLDAVQIPTFCSPIAKTIVNEDHPCFVGIYNGVASQPGMNKIWEECDVVVVLGNHPSDTNTAGFTRHVSADRSISISPYHVTIAGKTAFQMTPMRDVLAELAQLPSLASLKHDYAVRPPRQLGQVLGKTEAITQSWIWHRLAEFMEPDDVIVGETGTTSFGLPMALFPTRCQWITQGYYGSIGYATPAAFGADIALGELFTAGMRARGRTLLVTGDGSLMLTVQEVGNMIEKLTMPIIFIINNSGYTIERAIHGAHKKYNDIVPFDYSCMLQFLGMSSEQAKESFHRVSSRSEMNNVLQKKSVLRPRCLQVIEVVMDKMDIPQSLFATIATRGPETEQMMREAGFKIEAT